MDKLAVNCYSGFTYAERPQSFIWRGEERTVCGMDGAWVEPGRRCFRVSTEGGRRFDLSYLESQDRWAIVER